MPVRSNGNEKNIDSLFAICYTINMTNITEIHDISAVLRAIRAHLDLTQEQLADRLGVAFATVNRWEGGCN